jgi:hypothetical protein
MRIFKHRGGVASQVYTASDRTGKEERDVEIKDRKLGLESLLHHLLTV